MLIKETDYNQNNLFHKEITYTYDIGGRPSIIYIYVANRIDLKIIYKYDKIGNILSKTELTGNDLSFYRSTYYSYTNDYIFREITHKNKQDIEVVK